MPLKLAAATLTYLWSCDLETACRRIADIGFRAVEVMCASPHLWPRGFSGEDRAALGRMLGTVGLEIVAINPTYLDMNLASPNPGFREESIRQLRELIALAADVGAPRVVTVAGKRHPLLPTPVDRARRWATDAIAECVPLAEQLGVELTLENAWNVADDAESVMEMARQLRSDRVRIVYDSANSLALEPAASGFAKVSSHLTHVHLSDARHGAWSHAPIGTGEVDFAEIHATLVRQRFAGVSVIEAVDPERPDAALAVSKAALERLGWQA